MEQHPIETSEKRSIWVRGLYMLLMAVAYHLSGVLLCVIAVTQFIFAVFTEKPNLHLISFARNLALYYQQNVNFLTFVTEQVPFPFNDWPS